MSRNNRQTILKFFCVALSLVLLCAASGAGSAYFILDRYSLTETADQSAASRSENDSAADTEAESINSSGLLSATDIYDLALEQVVAVKSTSTTQNIFGQETTSATSGTGFVISSDGYIMTNYHVIEYSVLYGYDLSVIFSDGTSYPAEIVGYYSDNDIAVIKIDADGLNAVSFGDSDSMEVGEIIYCVGNPLGELDFTMTSGIISALDRVIATDAYTSINMFQIDAAVNSGNSGGPVFDEYGNVIGIVTAKYSDEGVEGLGFAIPINDAVAIASDLIEHGYVTGKASLGISARDVEQYVSQYYSIPSGVYVYSVNDGSCAANAGIQAGDVITAVGDEAVENVESLKSVLSGFAAGDSADITVYRSNEYLTFNVTFDEQLPESSSETENYNDSPSQSSYVAPFYSGR